MKRWLSIGHHPPVRSRLGGRSNRARPWTFPSFCSSRARARASGHPSPPPETTAPRRSTEALRCPRSSSSRATLSTPLRTPCPPHQWRCCSQRRYSSYAWNVPLPRASTHHTSFNPFEGAASLARRRHLCILRPKQSTTKKALKKSVKKQVFARFVLRTTVLAHPAHMTNHLSRALCP